MFMSQYTVYIKAPDYLDQWLRSEYWDEETRRIVFPRGSAPRAVLQSVLRKTPSDYKPGDVSGLLPVAVPTFKRINPSNFNYLTADGEAALVSACKSLFKSVLYEDLGELFLYDIQITDIIYNFLDKHGIERTEKNWDTVRQMYLRMRKKARRSQC